MKNLIDLPDTDMQFGPIHEMLNCRVRTQMLLTAIELGIFDCLSSQKSREIGEGYDLIWASSTLSFARQDLTAVLKKIYEALTPGGVFISMAEGVYP